MEITYCRTTASSWKLRFIIYPFTFACLLTILYLKGDLFLPPTPRTIIEKYHDGVGKKENTTDPADTRVADDDSSSNPISSASLYCSCWNATSITAVDECCERKLLRGHKFGTLVTDKYFRAFRNQIQRVDIHPRHLPWYDEEDEGGNENSSSRNVDYRHVVVSRNMYSAIVSGYLYHQAGNECWIDHNGHFRHYDNIDWEERYMTHKQIPPIPHPRNGRSICMYLKQESRIDGMRVYIDVVLAQWYSGVLSYKQLVEQRRKQQQRLTVRRDEEASTKKTMFVCFEDFTNPTKQESIFYDMMNWFYPGRDLLNVTIPEPPQVQRYDGVHSTNTDHELRSQLRTLVERLDREVFNGTLATINEAYGCGMDNSHTVLGDR